MIIRDVALELEFAQPPTAAALFAAFHKQLGQAGQQLEGTGLKLYFRQRDGNYVGVTTRTASISWDMYDFDGNHCFARVAGKTPPSSPERPAVRPLLRQGDPAIADLASKLALLTTGAFSLDGFFFCLTSPDATTPAPVHLTMQQQQPSELSGSLSLEVLGFHFPVEGLEVVGDALIKHVADSWSMLPAAAATSGNSGAARNVRVLVTGGASGTGKTRFGAALPQVLLDAARRLSPEPSELINALNECVVRQLVLQSHIALNLSSPALATMLLDAYFNPPPTASSPRFKRETVHRRAVSTLSEAWALIARLEREWRPHTTNSR